MMVEVKRAISQAAGMDEMVSSMMPEFVKQERRLLYVLYGERALVVIGGVDVVRLSPMQKLICWVLRAMNGRVPL